MTGVWPQPPGEAFQAQSMTLLAAPLQRGCSENRKCP